MLAASLDQPRTNINVITANTDARMLGLPGKGEETQAYRKFHGARTSFNGPCRIRTCNLAVMSP